MKEILLSEHLDILHTIGLLFSLEPEDEDEEKENLVRFLGK